MSDQPFDLAAALHAAAGPADEAAGDGRLPADPSLAFAELARIDLRTHDLAFVLGRVAELAKATVPGADEVSVSILVDGGTTPAFTGTMARDADERQYQAGGPCVQAAETGEPVLMNDIAIEERWPDYTPTAARVGIASSMSMPLPTQRAVQGAINLYSRRRDAFDEDALALAETFAGYAGIAIANAHLYEATASHARQMEQAMASRAVIEQAKGLIMGQRRCTADEAFQVLARASQRSNRKLRDIAAEIVQAAQRR